MIRFCVQGVVRDGQVVLDIPLDLPDGAIVIVTDTPPDDVEVVGPMLPPSPELVKQMILGIVKEPTCSTIRTGYTVDVHQPHPRPPRHGPNLAGGAHVGDHAASSVAADSG